MSTADEYDRLRHHVRTINCGVFSITDLSSVMLMPIERRMTDIVITLTKPEESNGSIIFTQLKSRATTNPACSGSAVNLDDHHE